MVDTYFRNPMPTPSESTSNQHKIYIMLCAKKNSNRKIHCIEFIQFRRLFVLSCFCRLHFNLVCATLQDEKKRIEDLGGCIAFMGCWRVNGTYAVSRAIGKYIGSLLNMNKYITWIHSMKVLHISLQRKKCQPQQIFVSRVYSRL